MRAMLFEATHEPLRAAEVILAMTALKREGRTPEQADVLPLERDDVTQESLLLEIIP